MTTHGFKPIKQVLHVERPCAGCCAFVGDQLLAIVGIGLGGDGQCACAGGELNHRVVRLCDQRDALQASGKAVLATSLLLVSQFLLLSTSDFVPTANFGLLTAAGLIAGQLLELALLPAVLVLWSRLKLRSPLLRV